MEDIFSFEKDFYFLLCYLDLLTELLFCNGLSEKKNILHD